MCAQYVYTMQGVTKTVPGQRTILQNIHLSFLPGAKIGVLGLNGSGKTTLAKLLAPMFNAIWLNADEVRKEANDWDFSEQGRIRQANRMNTLAKEAIANNRIVVADFVCPTEKTRKDFNADYTIFMDTIKEGRYAQIN